MVPVRLSAAVPLLLLLSVVSGCSDVSCRPLVATREGVLRGVTARSADGRLFHAFRGIRYGVPPLGRLRLAPPRRHAGWQGVTDAAEHASRCLQVDTLDNDTVKGAEDCLFANVYTPRLPALHGAVSSSVRGLPVMVFIHGGGFTIGSGDDDFYGPSYMMDEDVVLVTFNYRLGPLGFFTTHDRHAPGNYGLLDQVMLLQWVQDNIASFGGDPGSVTIFGVSAGGASVSLLVLSPLTKGLFHHAISQSGTAVASFAASGRRKRAAETIAKRLGCPTGDIATMVDCVRDTPSEKLIESVRGEKELFQPRVDADSAVPLLPEDPHTLLERGAFNLVPWVSGITEEEGSFFLPFTAANKTFMSAVYSGDLAAWARLADLSSETNYSVLDCGANATEQAARVRQFYLGNGSVSSTNLLPVVRVTADRLFVAPMAAETRLASRHTSVYRYLLNERGAGRLSYRAVFPTPTPDFGPTHADDVLYLFSNAKLPLAARGSPAGTMIRFMVSLWTGFARTGRPSSTVLPMPDWPVFTEHHQRHMRLNLAPSVGERLFQRRADFWQTVPVNEPWRHAVQTGCQDGTRSPADSGTRSADIQVRVRVR